MEQGNTNKFASGRRRLVTALTGILAGIAMLAGGESRSADSPTPGFDKIRLIFTSQVILPNDAVPSFAVPEKLGFFKDERLDVTWTTSDGSSAGILAVASGGGDVTSASAVSSLPAIAKGLKVKTFAGLVVNWPYFIAVPPDSKIRSVNDLVGRKVGIISLASASYTFAQTSIKLAGLDPLSVQYIPVGDGPTASTALQSGQVDALALYTGSYQAMESVGVKLRYLANAPYFDNLFSTSWLAKASDLESKPELFARFVRAVNKALLFSAANPEAAMKMGYEIFPSHMSPKNLAADTETLKTWLRTATPTTGTPASWNSYQWGELKVSRWDVMQEFLIRGGVIKEKLLIDQIWFGALVPEINKFDRAAILKLAASR